MNDMPSYLSYDDILSLCMKICKLRNYPQYCMENNIKNYYEYDIIQNFKIMTSADTELRNSYLRSWSVVTLVQCTLSNNHNVFHFHSVPHFQIVPPFFGQK